MGLTDWLWLAFAIFGPLPLVWVWRKWRAYRSAKTVEQIKEYRRKKFGGFVSVPCQKDPVRLNRPAPGPHPWQD